MYFSDVLNRLPDVEASARQICDALDDGHWNLFEVTQRRGMTTRQIMVHIGQVARYSRLVTQTVLAQHFPTILITRVGAEEQLQRLAADVQQHPGGVEGSNLDAAKSKANYITGPGQLAAYMAESYELVRSDIKNYPDSASGIMVDNPLVTMRATVAEFMYRMVIEHSQYHFGQVIRTLQFHEPNVLVPRLPIFGELHQS